MRKEAIDKLVILFKKLDEAERMAVSLSTIVEISVVC